MAYPNNYPPQGVPPYPPQGVPPYPPNNHGNNQKGFPYVVGMPYQLTKEEKRVLKECASESFYTRCLPFMTALGLGTYYGVHLGYLKAHPSLAAGPKVAFSVMLGYILGKASYSAECDKKILRLSGGKLKEGVARRLNLQTRSDDEGDASAAYTMPQYTPAQFRSNEQSTAFEQDTERHHDTFDDSFRIRSGEGMSDAENLPPLVPPAQSTSYNELRNRNREEYEARHKQYGPGPMDAARGYAPLPPSADRYSKADAYQSPTSAADRASQSSVYQTPTGGFDHYQYPTSAADRASQSSVYQTPTGGFDQYGHSMEQRTPTPRKNFYGDVIDK